MPVFRNVNKLLNHITGKTKPIPVNIVAQRFVQVFNDHGVQTSQIPRLMPQLNLDDLNCEDSLLAVLTPKILDQTAQLFGIRSQWLEGVGDQIYEYLACYKQPARLLEHLSSLKIDLENPLIFPLRVLSTVKQLDRNDFRQQLLAPVLVEKIAELGDEWIYRYHIYQDGFDWSHPPARKELKAITRLVCNALHTIVPIFVIKPSEMDEILEGKLIPRKFLAGCLITSPSLEDYALTEEESGVAKEVDEIPEVLKYIEEYQLEYLVTAAPLQPNPPSEPISEPQAEPTTVEQVEPIGEQPATTTKKETPRGITKQRVIAAFEGLHFDTDAKWSKGLASPPNWLIDCRVAKGDKKTSATWNPVLIAAALYDRKIPIKKLNAVFVSLPEWADEWSEFFETLP